MKLKEEGLGSWSGTAQVVEGNGDEVEVRMTMKQSSVSTPFVLLSVLYRLCRDTSAAIDRIWEGVHDGDIDTGGTTTVPRAQQEQVCRTFRSVNGGFLFCGYAMGCEVIV